MTFLTIFRSTEILCSFRLVLEGKTGKEIPKSSRLEFLEKFSANNFSLSDAEANSNDSIDSSNFSVRGYLYSERILLLIYMLLQFI